MTDKLVPKVNSHQSFNERFEDESSKAAYAEELNEENCSYRNINGELCILAKGHDGRHYCV